jgi:transcriptional antiterminator NusG
MQNWYVLYCTSGREKSVRDKMNLRFANEPFNAFVPAKEKWFVGVDSTRNKVRKIEQVLLFRSYVFIDTDWNGLELLCNIKEFLAYCRDAYRILIYGKITGRVDDSPAAIERITKSMAMSKAERADWEWLLGGREIVENSIGTIDVGNQIHIESGPLKGQEGRIVRLDQHKRKAEIMFDIIGGSMRVTVPVEITSKVITVE